MTHGLRVACGMALIVVGVIAMPIPIIPGIPLVAAGVAMLGHDHPIVRSCRGWLKTKFSISVKSDVK